mmetsp:Transcript_15044/g.38795  ORF Transcript_15044/g.38795 Transcript_15044/m.38795 type:complete len:296 (+) Transcript_15044:165-1052(+)
MPHEHTNISRASSVAHEHGQHGGPRDQHQDHASSLPAIQVLILSFSFATVSEACNALQLVDCSCSQWEGVHIKSLENDTLVDAWVHTGLIAKPNPALGMKSHLGSALAHISAWRSIQDQRPKGTTLVVPEDEALRPAPTARLREILGHAALPTYDILFLGSSPEWLEQKPAPGMPRQIMRLAPNASAAVVQTKGARMHSYAMSLNGADTWIQLLRAAPPDLSMLTLDGWMLNQIRNNLTIRAFTWSNDTQLVEKIGSQHLKTNVASHAHEPHSHLTRTPSTWSEQISNLFLGRRL